MAHITGMLFNILLVGLTLTGLCQAKTRNCRGIQEYEDTHEICCGGQVTEKVDNQECCNGRKLFIPDESICCGGEVDKRYQTFDDKRVEMHCCGGQLHHKKGTYCCSNNIINITKEQENDRNLLTCCSQTSVANKKHEFCCEDTVYENAQNLKCCGNKIMATEHKKCHWGDRGQQIILKHEHFCGDQLYDMRKASCCHNEVNYIIPQVIKGKDNLNLRCCGSIPYDNSTRKCCPREFGISTAHTIPFGTECCGDTHINKTTQLCVNNQPWQRKSKPEEVCGESVYDPSDFDCCHGKLFNNSSQQCCEGQQGPNIISIDKKCCGGRGLEPTELCCYGSEPCPKKGDEDDECCFDYETNIIRTYCTKKEDCNGIGQVVEKRLGTELCGNNLSFRPKEEICCGMTKKSRAEGFNDCCEGQHFNNRTQQCCAGKIHDKTNQERHCCYFDGEVYAKNDHRNPCLERCSEDNDTFYNPDFEMCCDGEVHKAERNRECCGKESINTKRKECCGGQTSVSKKSPAQCCGSLKINSKKFGCCARTIPYKKKTHGCCGNRVPYRKGDYLCGDDNRVTRIGPMENHSLRDRFCHPDTIRYGDHLVEVACRPKVFGLVGIVQDIKVSRKMGTTVEVDMWISSAQQIDLDTYKQFWGETQRQIEIVVKSSLREGFKYRSKLFLRLKGKKVIIFSERKPIRRSLLEINSSEFIYMTKYTNFKNRTLSQLSSQFCDYIPSLI